MRVGLKVGFISLAKLEYLYRVVVVLLLILIFADIALPQVCCEEGTELCSDKLDLQMFVSNESLSNYSVADYSPTHKDEHSSCVPNNDGCFCCCAHFLIGKGLLLTTPFVNPPLAVKTVLVTLPSPPITTIFHPPRLS